MDEKQDTHDSGIRRNPVFWLMWLLPGAAVAASFATLAIALDGADTKLPAAYHWEGAALDEDFDRARRAFERGIGATLTVDAARGECFLDVRGDASDNLRLLLTHSADASLDRQVLLRRTATGDFRAPCASVPAGRWRVALDDDAAGWSLRARVDGALDAVELRARDPGGATS